MLQLSVASAHDALRVCEAGEANCSRLVCLMHYVGRLGIREDESVRPESTERCIDPPISMSM